MYRDIFIRTDSLSEAEERRDLTVLVRRKRSLMSEVWLVTVERLVDMKLLSVERRSRLRTHSNTPRHGRYLAMSILIREASGENKEKYPHEKILQFTIEYHST